MMLLSQYIAKLQDCLENDGDYPVYYSRDDEGNGYQQVTFSPAKYYTMDLVLMQTNFHS